MDHISENTGMLAWVLRQNSLAVDTKDSAIIVFLSHPVATELSPRKSGAYPFSHSPENTF